MIVYIVKQYQYDNYETIAGEPVYVFETEDLAKEAVIQLNKEYSDGVSWATGEEYLTVDEYDCVNEPHFYTYGVFIVNDKMPKTI